MQRHKQASNMPSMDSNNNPRWGHSLSRPPHCTLHLLVVTVYPVPQEFRRLKTQGSGPLLIGYIIFTVCSCNSCIFIIWIFVSLNHMCSFQENHVNIFALCSWPYRYSWFISGLAALASCMLSFQTTVCYNVCPKHLIFGAALYYNIVAILLYCVQFFRFNIQFQESPYPQLFVGDALLRCPPYACKVDLFVVFHVIGHCSLIFYIPYDAYSVILPYCYETVF